MTEVLAARGLLERDWGIPAAIWSVTSYAELHRDGIECERRMRSEEVMQSRQPFVTRALNASCGPIIAASDYVRALPELIRAVVPRRFVTLGTDGFGRSDTRSALRRFFEVDAVSIVIAALDALAAERCIGRSTVAKAMRHYGRDAQTPSPWSR